MGPAALGMLTVEVVVTAVDELGPLADEGVTTEIPVGGAVAELRG